MVLTIIIAIILVVLLALVLGPKHRGASQVVRDMFPGGFVPRQQIFYTSKTKQAKCMEDGCGKPRQHRSRRCFRHSLKANV